MQPVKYISLFSTLLSLTASAATLNFTGNGNSGFSGAVGLGNLDIITTDTTVNGTLNEGGNLNDAFVMYIDSTTGGFNSTANFTDTGDALRNAISGSGTITFATGFTADYAVAFNNGFAGVWQLVENGSHTFITSANQTDSGTGNWGFDFSFADIGNPTDDIFNAVIVYTSGTGFLSDEAIGVASGTYTGNPGNGNITFGAQDFIVVPEPGTYAMLAGLLSLSYIALMRRR